MNAAKTQKMTGQQEKILSYIQVAHVGKSKGISQKALANTFGISTRRLQDIIAELVDTFEQPICCHTTWGYFWPATREEASPVINQLKARGVSTLRHQRALEQALDGYFNDKPQLTFDEVV